MSKNSIYISKLNSFIDEATDDLCVKKYPNTLYAPIHYHLSNKGKKTRSILCLLSYKLFNDNITDCKPLISAIESLHEFTLIHDDIMDCASTRRGQLTINKKWSNSQAIISGDVLLINAYRHLLNLSEFNNSIIKIFTETSIKICEGQQLDMDFAKKKSISLQEYLEMIDLKTGALIEFSMISPALMLNLETEVIKLIKKIGSKLGQLFQIQDDFIDIYGQYADTGKLIGKDVIERKKTFLYLKAVQSLDNDNMVKFTQLYNSDLDDKIYQVKLLYDKIGIKGLVLEEMHKIYQKINLLIGELPHSNLESKKTLKDFINTIYKRKK